MQVYQIRMKLYLLQDIPARSITKKLTAFIDQALVADETFAEFHNTRAFKFYVFDQLYPIPEDKIYSKGKIYTLTIRTVKPELAEFFSSYLIHTHTEFLKGLTGELRVLPQKHLEMIYSLTPVIVKPENGGYWKQQMPLPEYERLLTENLIKKWNAFHNLKIDEGFQFCTLFQLKNHEPIPFGYKAMTLLGDKLCLHITDDPMAQRLAYFSLGAGVGTMNSRGAGFMNYRYL